MELIARIEAILRRVSYQEEALEQFTFADVGLDLKRYEATRKGVPLELSPREFRILKCLIERRGAVVSHAQLHESAG